jgi:hypothetical protein
VTYYKAFLRRESGEISRARFEEAIGAVADAHYRRVLVKCFEPEENFVCRRFLESAGAAYNQKTPPGERVVEFDIQKWAWNFRQDPDNPNYGERVDRFRYPVAQ